MTEPSINDVHRHDCPEFRQFIDQIAPKATQVIDDMHWGAPGSCGTMLHYQFDDLCQILHITPREACALYRRAVECVAKYSPSALVMMTTNTSHPVESDGFMSLLHQDSLDDPDEFKVRARVFIGDLVPDQTRWSIGSTPYVFDGQVPEECIEIIEP